LDTETTCKKSSVVILKNTPNPNDPSTALLTVCVDLTRPADIAKDFARELRKLPAVPLPSRKLDPRLFSALRLVEKGLSLREASNATFGNDKKASALCRLRAAFINAASEATCEKH
jgi:hypothetical protein